VTAFSSSAWKGEYGHRSGVAYLRVHLSFKLWSEAIASASRISFSKSSRSQSSPKGGLRYYRARRGRNGR